MRCARRRAPHAAVSTWACSSRTMGRGPMALRTRLTELLDIEHPVVLGGMGRGATVPPMVAAVSEAGGLGVLGVTRYPADRVAEQATAVRSATPRPFGLNLLLFAYDDDAVDA